MKHTNRLILTIAALAATTTAAEARKLSIMEWIDPQSMTVWRELTDADKTASVQDYLQQSGMEAGEQQVLAAPIKACLDKEVADPDYNGVKVALMIPWSHCLTKHTAIMDAKKNGN